MPDHDQQSTLPQAEGDFAALSAEARALIDLITKTDVTELELAKGDTRLVIKRATSPQYAQPQYAQPQYAQPQYAQPQYAPLAQPGPAPTASHPPAEVSHLRPLIAPMVGTFYHSSSPTEKPYVTEGALVEKGQTIGLIEAMKMMNEIEAEISGRVVRLVAENGKPVEYGQTLMLIDPDSGQDAA